MVEATEMPSQQQVSRTPIAARDSWRTPLYAFEWAVKRWGPFDVDVAASEYNRLCPVYYTKEQAPYRHALGLTWYQEGTNRTYFNDLLRGWCNPPYSSIEPFIDQAIRERDRFEFETTFFIPTPNGDARDQTIFEEASDIVFITGEREVGDTRGRSGRISFIGHEGRPVSGNTRGSCFAHFSPRDRGADSVEYVSKQTMMRESEWCTE